MFDRNDWDYIENLGDDDLLRNKKDETLYAMSAHENIVVKRVRVASLDDEEIKDINEQVQAIDDAEYSDQADDAANFIEEIIKQEEIEQYINNKKVK